MGGKRNLQKLRKIKGKGVGEREGNNVANEERVEVSSCVRPTPWQTTTDYCLSACAFEVSYGVAWARGSTAGHKQRTQYTRNLYCRPETRRQEEAISL